MCSVYSELQYTVLHYYINQIAVLHRVSVKTTPDSSACVNIDTDLSVAVKSVFSFFIYMFNQM